MLGYCERREDAALLKRAARDAAAQFDLPEWQAELLLSLALFLERLDADAVQEICCVDVTPRGAVHAAEAVRQRFEHTRLLLLAALDTSPMTYLRPSIRASSLLLRPFSEEQARNVMVELLEDMVRELRKGDPGAFTLETKQGRQLVHYNDILYFESRERRIYLCTKSCQLPFYDTLERLTEELPEQFLRCHKGFIVNKTQIERIAFAENTIHLRGGYQIPVSRSYKAAVKEATMR